MTGIRQRLEHQRKLVYLQMLVGLRGQETLHLRFGVSMVGYPNQYISVGARAKGFPAAPFQASSVVLTERYGVCEYQSQEAGEYRYAYSEYNLREHGLGHLPVWNTESGSNTDIRRDGVIVSQLRVPDAHGYQG